VVAAAASQVYFCLATAACNSCTGSATTAFCIGQGLQQLGVTGTAAAVKLSVCCCCCSRYDWTLKHCGGRCCGSGEQQRQGVLAVQVSRQAPAGAAPACASCQAVQPGQQHSKDQPFGGLQPAVLLQQLSSSVIGSSDSSSSSNCDDVDYCCRWLAAAVLAEVTETMQEEFSMKT